MRPSEKAYELQARREAVESCWEEIVACSAAFLTHSSLSTTAIAQNRALE